MSEEAGEPAHAGCFGTDINVLAGANGKSLKRKIPPWQYRAINVVYRLFREEVAVRCNSVRRSASHPETGDEIVNSVQISGN